MTEKVGVSSFESGVVFALASIRLYLQSRPDWDEAEFNKYVSFFKATKQSDAERASFEQALNAIHSSHPNIIEAISQIEDAKS
ncbi:MULTISPECIES: hypothetical protein [unclassified Pseudomonas]|uniref:hypothetical protein n=1 Tax=unclassified Pseudomonas TaxID=196821 RepID=UPI0011AF6281|nr:MULTISPECIES: hypothetical protein [unclassified Pseudomonas]